MSCESINSSLFTFPCSQPPPAPLPDTPATAVTFAFDGDGAFTAAAAANVGEALNLIDDFLACLQPPCEASEGQVYLADSDGQMRLVDASDLVSEALSDLLPGAGQFLYNAGGVVAAVDFCTQVQTCLNNLATSPGQVLMSTPSGIAGVDLCSEVQNCLGNLTGSDGQFLIQQGGAVRALDHCQAVQSCLSSLLPANGSVLTGNGSGGVTATNLCQEVMACLEANSTPGTFFLNNGGNVSATDFVTAVDNALAGSTNLCDQVEGCFGGALSPGEVYYNGGAGTMPTDLVTLLAPFLAGLALNCVEVQNCLGGPLAPGQVYFNNGAGTAPTDIEDAVNSAIGLPGTPGEVIAVDGTGNNVESRTLFQVLDDGAPAGSSGQACKPETLLNDGSGWRVGKGIPEAPTAWAFGGTPSSPQSHPLQLEVNTGTGCPEWQPRDHITGTFNIPGDFPTMTDFANWAQGKSMSATVIYTGSGENVTFQYVIGYLGIAGTGSLGDITLAHEANLNLTLLDMTLNSLAVKGTKNHVYSLNLRITGTATVEDLPRTIDSGLTLTDGATMNNFGTLTIDSSGGNGITLLEGSTLWQGSSLALNNFGQYGLLVLRTSTVQVAGELITNNNGTNGVAVLQNSFVGVGGNLTSDGNSLAGVLVSHNSTLAAVAINAANNSTGVYILRDSSATASELVTCDNNVNVGLQVEKSSSFTADNGLNAGGNGAHGVLSFENGNVRIFGSCSALNNGFAGVFADIDSNVALSGDTSQAALFNGNAHGVLVSINSSFSARGGIRVEASNNAVRGFWMGGTNATVVLAGDTATLVTHAIQNNVAEGIQLGENSRFTVIGSGVGTGINVTGNAFGVRAAIADSVFSAATQVNNIAGNGTDFTIPVNLQDNFGNLIAI